MSKIYKETVIKGVRYVATDFNSPQDQCQLCIFRDRDECADTPSCFHFENGEGVELTWSRKKESSQLHDMHQTLLSIEEKFPNSNFQIISVGLGATSAVWRHGVLEVTLKDGKSFVFVPKVTLIGESK